MEKLCLLSDVHGNALALEKVIEQEGYDASYIFLGDLMGLCGYPSKTLQLTQEYGQYVLAGNHDIALFKYGEGHVHSKVLSQFEYKHTHEQLSDEEKDWVKELPTMKVLTVGGDKICLTHAYPWPEKSSGFESGNTGVTKRDIASVASAVGEDYDYVFHGHTHTQYELDCSKFGHDVHFVNPGSLGYNHEYATIDTTTGDVELKQVDYTFDEVIPHLEDVLPDDAPHPKDWL